MKEHEVGRVHLAGASFENMMYSWPAQKEEEGFAVLRKIIVSLPAVLESTVPMSLGGQVEVLMIKQCVPEDQGVYLAIILREIGDAINQACVMGFIDDLKSWIEDASKVMMEINEKDDPDRIMVIPASVQGKTAPHTIYAPPPVVSLVKVFRRLSKNELTVELGGGVEATLQKNRGSQRAKEDEIVRSDLEGQVVGVLQVNLKVLLSIPGRRGSTELSYPVEMRDMLLDAQKEGWRMRFSWREIFHWSAGVKKVTGGVIQHAERVPELFC